MRGQLLLLHYVQVSKLVHAIKMGWIKPRVDEEKVTDEPDKVAERKYYQLWEKDDAVISWLSKYI